MTNKSTKSDPFYQRESEQYENPVPSREYILSKLQEIEAPIGLDELLSLFEITHAEEIEGLHRRIKAMCRDGQLESTRSGQFKSIDESKLVRGVVQGNKDGYGFLIPHDGSDDLYLSYREMYQVLPGDEVLAKPRRSKRGKLEASIVRVVARARDGIVGRYCISPDGDAFVEPCDTKIGQDLLVSEQNTLVPQEGDYVWADIVIQPSRKQAAECVVTKILGNQATPGIETHLAALSYDIPVEFTEAVLAESDAIGDVIPASDLSQREDYREYPFVTIDGADARDFDDAVCCHSLGSDGWQLMVAIADVAHYVKPKSALDESAYERGNSVYFPNLVVPMLPQRLSNGICSLCPDEDRLVMLCEMQISKSGAIESYALKEAVIHSHARLTYHQANEIIEAKVSDHPMKSALHALSAVFDALHENRQARGAIDFDVPSPRFIFDAQGKIESVGITNRIRTHRIIEEAMLAANVSVACFLEEAGYAFLYRRHDGPDIEKLMRLRSFLAAFGLQLKGGDEPSPADYLSLLDSASNMPEISLIQTVMLRSLKQAHYSPDNTGHFGLAYSHYCHFTSPIRRYPDLLVHRAIKAALKRGKQSEYMYDDQMLNDFGEHCSMTERRADHATRDAMDRLQCEYMEDKLGQSFNAKITDVTGFGVFVECEDIYIKGMVHISQLGKDYFVFDREHYRLVGERSGQCYSLGDSLSVQLARVSVEDRKIDFVIAD